MQSESDVAVTLKGLHSKFSTIQHFQLLQLVSHHNKGHAQLSCPFTVGGDNSLYQTMRAFGGCCSHLNHMLSVLRQPYTQRSSKTLGVNF